MDNVTKETGYKLEINDPQYCKCTYADLSQCDNESECIMAGGYWYNDLCDDSPQNNNITFDISDNGTIDVISGEKLNLNIYFKLKNQFNSIDKIYIAMLADKDSDEFLFFRGNNEVKNDVVKTDEFYNDYVKKDYFSIENNNNIFINLFKDFTILSEYKGQYKFYIAVKNDDKIKIIHQFILNIK